jgi:gamma-glutamyltranspeptidase/glutathione hydrolase
MPGCVPWRGPLAANTVAGTISGWQAALESDGGHRCSRLLRDAIAHAEAGVAVTAAGRDIAAAKGPELRIQPGAYAAVFRARRPPSARAMCCASLGPDAAPAGDEGLDSFYRGPLAADIAAIWPRWAARLAPPILPRIAPRAPPRRMRQRAMVRSITRAPRIASLLILALFDRWSGRDDSFDHVHGWWSTKQAFLWRDAIAAIRPIWRRPAGPAG